MARPDFADKYPEFKPEREYEGIGGYYDRKSDASAHWGRLLRVAIEAEAPREEICWLEERRLAAGDCGD